MTDELPKRGTRRDGDRGAVVMIVALSMGVLITFTAFSIDLGRQMLKKRDAQAVADVVAMDLSRLLDGHEPSWFNSGGAFHAQFEQAKNESAARNHALTAAVNAEAGQQGSSGWQIDNNQPATAVRVTVSDSVGYYFAPGSGAVNRSAVASQQATACYKLGSFAAALNSGNSPLLDLLIGDALNVTGLSYSGLAAASVTLFDIATELGFGTPEQVLTSDVAVRDFVLATADVLQRNGDSANATLLNTLAGQLGPGSISISDLLNVSGGGEDAGLASDLNVLDLIAAAAFLSNGTNALAVPALNVNLPLANVQGALHITESPRGYCGFPLFGNVAPGARTAQLSGVNGSDHILTLTVDTSILPLVDAHVATTVDLSLASAESWLRAVRCGAPGQTDIEVINGLLRTGIELNVALTVAGIPLASVPISVGTTRTAASQTVTLAWPPDSMIRIGQPSDPLGSLVVDVGQLRGVIGGLADIVLILVGGVDAVVDALLNVVINPLISAISNQLVQPLLELLGVQYGGADVFLHDITCAGTKLVQ